MEHLALRILKTSFFPAILFLIALILSIQNYTPGTFLSGWDTLHPEFDFKLNILRTFFGVFRPEQGLGAVAAHAHMVELPRIFILNILDFFFPIAQLRYIYIFICLIAGPLGMYFFLNRILIKRKLPSFLGALFYLLNLGTYQTFLVPFEMFTTLYATLPFVFWLFAEYLATHKKRLLIFFSITVIMTAPAAYASTLWFIFFASLLLFFVPYILIQRKHSKGIVKRSFILIGILLALNLYWMLPNIYFALTQGSNIASANINKLFSEEAFAKNKEFGNIKDILLLKSFYFDWGIYNFKTGGFEQLTQAFQQFLAQPLISVIEYIFSATFIIGLFVSLKKAKSYAVSFILLTFFCLFFLINANPPFEGLFSFFQNHIPLFKEAFRFPDDKILNIFVFLVSIFFSYTMLFLTSLIKKFKLVLSSLLTFAFCLLTFTYMLPFFSGNLIHPFMRVTIPIEYFDLFESIKQSSGRIANFPVNSPWGWTYHNWYGQNAPSFQGAGFLYFGMSEPILERDFDRWNTLNEKYYREISHAVYAEDVDALKKVIKKYDISSLLVDTSVINPGSDGKSLYYSELEILLDELQKTGFITKKTTFGTFLTLYKVQTDTPLLSTLTEQWQGQSLPFADIIDSESKILPEKITTTDTNISLNLPKNTYTVKSFNFNQTTIPASVIATLKKTDSLNILSVNLYPTTPLFDDSSLLAPIQGNFEYPLKTDAILTVNRQVFDINTLVNENPTSLGSVFLNSSLNQVALFDPLENEDSYPVSDIPFSFGYCSGGNNSDLNILAHPDSISLMRPHQNSVCITTPLYFIKIPEDTSTVLININFYLKNFTHITACLTNPINGKCFEYLPIKNENGARSISFAINKNDLADTQLILNVDKGATDQTLSKLAITSSQSIAESLLNSSFFKNTLPQTFAKVSLPKVIDTNYYAVAEPNTSFENDCKNSKNISEKNFVAEEQMYRYSSKMGSFCDHISFPNLPHSLSYLVYVKSKNETGLPMNFCITNYTSRRCDIYSKLSRFKAPQEDVFMLPSSDLEGTGYDINLENVGVKGTSGVNNFYSVTFVPIDFALLSQIQTGNLEVTNYQGKISSQTIYNPMLMTVKTEHSPTLLTLSYAYNSGFTAYEVSCSNGIFCPLSYLFRPLFGNELKHIEVNSWKNGWIVPRDGTILIIFIPQYLEYTGILILAITLTILLSYPIANHFLKNTLDEYFEKQTEALKRKIQLKLSILNT